MAKPIEIDPRDLGDDETVDPSAIGASQDMGPGARRVAAGKAPQPTVAPDEDISPPITAYRYGKDSGKPVKPDALVFHDDGQPYERGYTDTPLANDPLARAIVGGIVAQGAGAFAGAAAAPLAEALGGVGKLGAAVAPYVEPAAAGAGAGAAGAAMEGQNPGYGALAGAGLSSLMHFVGSRATERVAQRPFKDLARKGTQAQKENLTLNLGPQDVTDVINRYNIGSVNRPGVAHDAVTAAIQRAEDSRDAVKQSISAVEQTMPWQVHAQFGKGHYEPVAGFPTRAAAERYADSLKYAAGRADMMLAVDTRHLSANEGLRKSLTGELKPNATILAENAGPRASLVRGVSDDLKERVIEAAHGLVNDEGESEREHAGAKVAAEARNKLTALNRDLTILNAMRPITAKLATADKLRQTWIERAHAKPTAIPAMAVGAVAKPITGTIQASVRASDFALAQLFKARAAGEPLTSHMLESALAAGVAPNIVAHFGNAQNPQHAYHD